MMRALLILFGCLALSAQANAPTDAKLHCGSLVGRGAIQVPLPNGKFSIYVIECEFKGQTV